MSFGYLNKNKLRLSLFLILLISQTILAQGSGIIRGKVFDKVTNDGLPGANVIVKGTSFGTATDLDGKFVLRNIPAGKQTFLISYIGYLSETVEVNVIAGSDMKHDFALMDTTILGNEVVVTAQAQGQLQAINQQLSSDKIANIVSEARIQELPDFNAASALSRLPGVSTTQSSGEDNKVVIRGLSPKYNSIEVEGVTLSATGSSQIGLSSNNGTGNGNVSTDRSVDLSMISPYMIRTIAVYKSLTPDMNANSIGGTVNMELREAPAGLHTDILWQSGYTAKSKTYGNYRGVFSGSNRFFNDKLGLYALFNAESYDRNSDNMSAGYGIAGDNVLADPVTGFRPMVVNDVTFNRHLETRKRYGGNLIFDYALPNGSIKFVNLFARINSNYTEHQQIIHYDTGVMNWLLRNGENNTDQRMHSIKFNYDFGFISSSLSASYTSASNVLNNSPQISFNETDALQANVPRVNQNPEEIISLVPNFKGNDKVVLRSADLLSTNYKDRTYSYKADFEIPYNVGSDVTGLFKFGGQYSDQSNSIDQETPYVAFDGKVTSSDHDIKTILMKAVQSEFGISTDDGGNLIGSSFVSGDKGLYDPFLNNKYGSYYYAGNIDLMKRIINYVIGNPAFDASNKDASSGAQGGWYNGPYQSLGNDYNYKEKYYASYGMLKINFQNFIIIGGARYEKVKSNFFAYNARDQRNPQAQIMYDTTSIQENEFLLPMAQVKYSPIDWLDVRYAYTQTLSRPDYNSLNPKFTITQNNQIYTGNPELKPAKSFNHDVSVSVHTNGIGLFTVGGFYKKIKDFVYNASYRLDLAEEAGIDALYRYQIFRNGAPVVTPTVNATTKKADATVYRPLNNPFDANVKGIELDFQHNFWYLPKPFSDMVFGINYARIYSNTKYPFFNTGKREEGTGRDKKVIFFLIDTTAPGRLIDQPNHVLNSYLGYDYKGFSARVSVVFQDNKATGNGGVDKERDSYSTQYFRLDFSARQKFDEFNTEIFLDVNNINNANPSGIIRATGGFTSIQNYGLVANLGIRFRY